MIYLSLSGFLFQTGKMSTSKIHGVGVFKREDGWMKLAYDLEHAFLECCPYWREMGIVYCTRWSSGRVRMGDPKSVHCCLAALVKSKLWLVLIKLSDSWGCLPNLHPSMTHEPVNHTQKQCAELKFLRIHNTSVPFLSKTIKLDLLGNCIVIIWGI